MTAWKDMAFEPENKLVSEMSNAWSWLIKEREFRPFLCSKLGDVFFASNGGVICRLSCSEGMIERVCQTREEFDNLCRQHSEEVDFWFAPSTIDELHANGNFAGQNEAYTFVILPIFEECASAKDNIQVVPIDEVFVGLSSIHKHVADLPNSASVQIQIVD